MDVDKTSNEQSKSDIISDNGKQQISRYSRQQNNTTKNVNRNYPAKIN